MKSLKALWISTLVTVVISSCQLQSGNIPPTLLVEIASPTGIGPEASTPTFPALEFTPTTVSTAPVVSAESCASASSPAPVLVDPNASVAGLDTVGLIDRSLGGGVVQGKEFTIELLLYCNSNYGPGSMEPYLLSDIAGLALYFQWRYEGTIESGPAYAFSGFAPELHGRKEPADSLRPGQMLPPGTNAMGIHFPADKLPDFSRGTSMRYLYILQGPSGQYSGAALSFDLQQAADGIQPKNIVITALSDAELESLKSTLPPVTQ
jgi:hypothetical protein